MAATVPNTRTIAVPSVAGSRCSPAEQLIGHSSALPVREAGQRNRCRATGDCVDDLDRVADSKDVGRRGAQVLIDDDRSARSEGEPGGGGQVRFWAHPDRHQYQVGWQHGSIFELYIEAGPAGLPDCRHRCREVQPDARAE